MQPTHITPNQSSKLYNDYIVLDNHIVHLETSRIDIRKTYNEMESRIISLNDKGFQDGNFENLYHVFTENISNIKRIEQVIQNFENHCKSLSKIIKEYYNVEL